MTLPRHGGDENLPAIRHELISLFSGTSDKILKPQMKRNAVLNVTKTTTVCLQLHYHTTTATLCQKVKRVDGYDGLSVSNKF